MDSKHLFMQYLRIWKHLTTLANTNTNIQEEFRKNYSYSSTGTINGNINQENVNQNVTLKTTARRDKNSGRYYADITLQNASQDILKYSYINDNDIYAIKCDDILPNYIGARNSNLKEYAKNGEYRKKQYQTFQIKSTLKFLKELLM